MQRIANGVVRSGWAATNARLGLVYNDTGAGSYWSEGPFYDFDLSEILVLEQAAAKVQQMCVAAGDHIVQSCPRHDAEVRRQSYLDNVCGLRGCLMSRLGIPEFVHEQVIRTWHDGSPQAWTHRDKDLFGTHAHSPQGPDFSPNLYGRFDFWYGGKGTVPKLLEYNAQTPTSLIEAAVIQWAWLEETRQSFHPERQWTSIHERLIEAWQRNLGELRQARPWLPEKPTVFFAYDGTEPTGEDQMTVAYLMETARQAGFPTQLITVGEVGLDQADGRLRHNGVHIDVIFVLYPWEWLWHEEGGKPIFTDMADPMKQGTVWIEPPWTAALWSNKGLLPVLWKLFGDDPANRDLLLPAYFADERPAAMTSYARKPIWSREGANIDLVRAGETVAHQTGTYGEGGFVYQELCELPAFDGGHPVLGVWMVDGEPAGMGIREGGLITGNGAHFVPHVIGR